MTAQNATTRFSDRVADYVRYRPGYPPEVTALLKRECGLVAGAAVADVGSGTGIFTAVLLGCGAEVWAVEPNEPMRRAAEGLLAENPRFHSVAGRAEATSLPAGSVDLVTVAQAFHWFDLGATRAEFARILRPGGKAALVWNDRRTGGSAIAEGYEAILQAHAIDYREVAHRRIGSAEFDRFFGCGRWRTAAFASHRDLDYESLRGRLLSASYAPRASSPASVPMLDALRRLFDAHQKDGCVRMEYDTRVFWGPVAAG